MSEDFVDITPTPRVLRILGDIPFEPWQCFAELIDNSLDAFAEADRIGIALTDPNVQIAWSRDSVSARDKEIQIVDNAQGMSLSTLQRAARAGYSSNDPVNNLGLFGMGFNIATARLGDETLFLSATSESTEWIGIKINFSQLIGEQSFSAPVIRVAKDSPNEHGTKVIIRKLKDGVTQSLKQKETKIRKQLQTIYTPILQKNTISIMMQGKTLVSSPLCVWNESRFVMYNKEKVPAIVHIDKDWGNCPFDVSKNRYLTEEEIDVYEALPEDQKPNNIILRPRRLTGWIGIQRFCDTTDYGLDFIRNGRKILIGHKDFFNFENPETGRPILEYPTDLGTSLGGRIVGELNVDYLIPNYQKNGFDYLGRIWTLTREAIRGIGPILPQKRKSLGYEDENSSPLAKLINAYRRPVAGTKCLMAPNQKSKEMHLHFLRGEWEYIPDDKWYKVAQESDREKAEGSGTPTTPVNTGDTPSDSPGDYLDDDGDGDMPVENPPASNPPASNPPTSNPPTSDPPVGTSSPKGVFNKKNLEDTPIDELLTKSCREESLCGDYTYTPHKPGRNVNAHQIITSDCIIRKNGVRVPCLFVQDGMKCDFFFDPTHPTIKEYPITPKQLMLLNLAESFSIRDQVPVQRAFLGLIEAYLDDERINIDRLRDSANSLLSEIQNRLPQCLGERLPEVKKEIALVPSEKYQFDERLISQGDPYLWTRYDKNESGADQALAYIPYETLRRLIGAFPECFFDNKVFTQVYSGICIPEDPTRQKRLRDISCNKILSYLDDMLALLTEKKIGKQEAFRYANSISLLEKLMVY